MARKDKKFRPSILDIEKGLEGLAVGAGKPSMVVTKPSSQTRSSRQASSSGREKEYSGAKGKEHQASNRPSMTQISSSQVSQYSRPSSLKPETQYPPSAPRLEGSHRPSSKPTRGGMQYPPLASTRSPEVSRRPYSSSQAQYPGNVRFPRVPQPQTVANSAVNTMGTFLLGRDTTDSQGVYPSSDPTELKSVAPPSARSILRTENDKIMASRQGDYSNLKGRDRVEQEEWARAMILSFAPCPAGWGFRRVSDGYQCEGGHHLITHQQLSEGKGGMWMLPDGAEGDTTTRCGPYYPHPLYPTHFPYAGPLPIPDCCWEYAGDSLEEIEDSMILASFLNY
jgi:hypothetical protein